MAKRNQVSIDTSVFPKVFALISRTTAASLQRSSTEAQIPGGTKQRLVSCWELLTMRITSKRHAKSAQRILATADWS